MSHEYSPENDCDPFVEGDCLESYVHFAKPSGVASWPDVTRLYSHPPRTRTETFSVVRHPLRVVRSARGTEWNYAHSQYEKVVEVKHWIPFSYGRVWEEVSKDTKTLLWWTSFSLLSEAQLPIGRETFQMEDVFLRGNVGPLREIVRASLGSQRADAVDWDAVSIAATQAPRKNPHASAASTPPLWAELLASAHSRGVHNCALAAAESSAVRVAQKLCRHFKYSKDECEVGLAAPS
jgi:hypothetical protein